MRPAQQNPHGIIVFDASLSSSTIRDRRGIPTDKRATFGCTSRSVNQVFVPACAAIGPRPDEDCDRRHGSGQPVSDAIVVRTRRSRRSAANHLPPTIRSSDESRLIANQDGRVLENGPRDTQALALATRKARRLLPQFPVS